ncbi:LOW QUALITY PROTEIN: uncharacterized protein LOC115458582 [Microcaecilia unicolor]|uniref:LOW QUALITY PROTEIN: uncharacterized protein LOC115458582 n=1 Tax=Microcaecilia unicolor TaxID=1415580 RepID=A0A6P7WT09_9AMPH|nr:LOW QUALITY PROTEIN: uncharacterized protein LOC115458582 [Microcaecilia unicolor]
MYPCDTNIAPMGIANQSSTKYDAAAILAIDGNLNKDSRKGSCTHTEFATGSWWRLDLRRSWKIASIVVLNREDCCSQRLKDAEIRIGDRPDNSNPVCGNITDIRAGSITTLCCNGMEGRYVSVVLPNRKQYLTLCEVKVFPLQHPQDSWTNIAPLGIANQSSVAFNGSPRLAIDENPNTNYHRGSCIHTRKEMGAWWRLDLQRSWKIRSVEVVNRRDCCSQRLRGAQIRIGNSLDNNNPVCGNITDIKAGSITTLYCKGMEGRYVSVVLSNRKQYLSLCEVKVFPLQHPQDSYE